MKATTSALELAFLPTKSIRRAALCTNHFQSKNSPTVSTSTKTRVELSPTSILPKYGGANATPPLKKRGSAIDASLKNPLSPIPVQEAKDRFVKNLISRARGEEICRISDADFAVVADQLVRQSESSSGYYLNSESLKLLDDVGISKAVIRSLYRHMRPGGLDLGWEEAPASPGTTYSGSVVDSWGEPLGGIRIVLLSAGHRVLNWGYSRPDGRYNVASPENVEPKHLRFSGRGDLILTEFSVEKTEEQGETQIETLSGKLVTDEGDPVVGVSVQLLRWREGGDIRYQETGSKGGSLTWGDTDEFGQFIVPVRIEDENREWQAVLEILATKGQTLRKLIVTIHPSESLDLGHLFCPKPENEWGGEVWEQERSVVMYPGVSERPLG